MTVPMGNGKSGFFENAQREETDPGRLRQRPTTGNDNIDVLLANHAISGSRSLSQSFGWSWKTSKISNLALEFRRYLSEFHRCNYFRFWRPYRYFRLSVAVVFTWLFSVKLYMVLHPRFVVRILTVLFTASEIQAFPVSAAVSDCRLLLESPKYTTCEFAMIEYRRFVVECWRYMS